MIVSGMKTVRVEFSRQCSKCASMRRYVIPSLFLSPNSQDSAQNVPVYAGMSYRHFFITEISRQCSKCASIRRYVIPSILSPNSQDIAQNVPVYAGMSYRHFFIQTKPPQIPTLSTTTEPVARPRLAQNSSRD